jgi:putative ABC transport system permease protein
VKVIQVALRALAANKLRSALAVLGLFIGTFSFIAMIGIGKGAEKRASDSIQQLGVNLLFVYPGAQNRGMWRGTTQADTLTLEDAAALERLPYVVAVAPDLSRNYTIKHLSKGLNARVTGTSPEFMVCRNYRIGSGEFFSKSDILGKRRVVVLGAKLARDLFGEVEPIGKTIQIDRKNFRVVGVMEEKGGTGFMNFDEQAFVPVTTAQLRLAKKSTLTQIIVSLDDAEAIDAGMSLVDQAMARRHKIGPSGEPDYTVASLTEMRQRMQEMTGAFTVLLGGIAVVSLLVGGIGIMNIMLVSVTERTREIGIRKAVGAKDFDLLRQFVVESVTISCFGGLLGIVGGLLTSQVVGKLPVFQSFSQGEWKSEISPEAILLSFVFSVAVGMFFGIYPAMKAAKLSPVEALRYE